MSKDAIHMGAWSRAGSFRPEGMYGPEGVWGSCHTSSLKGPEARGDREREVSMLRISEASHCRPLALSDNGAC